MIGRFRTICVSAAALPLAACASFEGAPRPVLDLQKVTAIDPGYYPATALVTIQTQPDKMAYRNRVMTVYMSAMDARYAAFRTGLSKQLRGTNFGLEIATLGLGGLGAVWAKAAQEINAGTTFLTGSRGAFNKEVYFQQTLPALVAMMDANRLKVGADLISKQSRSIQDYPLEAAFADLSRYELSASIDGAVQQLNKEAAKTLDAAQARYAVLASSCTPDEAVGVLRGKINNAAWQLAGRSDPDTEPGAFPGTAKPEDLRKAAESMTGETFAPATSQDEADRQATAITDAIRANCNVNQLKALAAGANLRLGD